MSHFRLLRRLWRRCLARWYGARQIVEWDEIDINACMGPTTLLRKDWSPSLVRQLLGRPDYAILDLQRIRPPLRLYTRDRVAQAVASPRFRQHLAKLHANNARAGGSLRQWSVQYQLEAASAANATTHQRSATGNSVPAATTPRRKILHVETREF